MIKKQHKYLTRYEQKVLDRHKQALTRYKELKQENPDLSHNRLCNVIADEQEMSRSWVDTLVRRHNYGQKR